MDSTKLSQESTYKLKSNPDLWYILRLSMLDLTDFIHSYQDFYPAPSTLSLFYHSLIIPIARPAHFNHFIAMQPYGLASCIHSASTTRCRPPVVSVESSVWFVDNRFVFWEIQTRDWKYSRSVLFYFIFPFLSLFMYMKTTLFCDDTALMQEVEE